MDLHLVRSIFTIALAKPLQCPFNKNQDRRLGRVKSRDNNGD
jgi:hypothetical protein